GVTTRAGCGCSQLADAMDRWGILGCQKRRQLIVDRLMSNRAMLADAIAGEGAAHSVIGWALNTRLAEPVLKSGAEWLLNAAIEDVRKQVKEAFEGDAISSKRPRRFRVAGNSPFRMTSNKARFITSSQFQADIRTLLAMIPPDITAIAGVARSGLSVATMLSMYTHLPMLTIRQSTHDVVPTGNGWRLGGNRHVNPEKDKVLVVDDTVMTGNSLKAIRPLVESMFTDAVYAAIYVNPLANAKPDVWAVDLPWPHLLEWNLFNSVLSPSVALDFDGILCNDCMPEQDDDGERYLEFLRTSGVRYLPRKVPVPLIVTARLERYRSETEDWLRRHGVAWHRLVMHPAPTLSERNKDDIAAYKAMHFSEWAAVHRPTPGPTLFVESNDYQARRIAELSRRMVVCPGTASVYWFGDHESEFSTEHE
ncbi:MAG: phosphoribosyltransferase, partial [Planctomycetaceae bacterium]|nr:phosphoribosyltransferase [Planctomycetaceae bacterium]